MEEFTREKVKRNALRIIFQSLSFFLLLLANFLSFLERLFDEPTRGRRLYDPFVCFYSQPCVTQHAREKIDRQKIKRVY